MLYLNKLYFFLKKRGVIVVHTLKELTLLIEFFLNKKWEVSHFLSKIKKPKNKEKKNQQNKRGKQK